MSFDPSLLSTSIGAVVGLAITRKTLRPKDRTIGNQILGTGLGGAAGFATGQMIKGEQLAIRKLQNQGTPEQRLRKYWREQLPKGEVIDEEVQHIGKVMPEGLYGPEKLNYTDFGSRMKRNFLLRKARANYEQRVGHAARVQEFKRMLAGNPSISPPRKERILEAIKVNEERRDEFSDSLRSQARWGGVFGALWDTAWGKGRK